MVRVQEMGTPINIFYALDIYFKVLPSIYGKSYSLMTEIQSFTLVFLKSKETSKPIKYYRWDKDLAEIVRVSCE